MPKKESIAGQRPEAPDFMQWFGDSQAVSPNGAPMVVYHGTRQSFSSFDRIAGGNQYAPASYFTEDPAIASNYATGENVGRVTVDKGSPAVMPVYLSARKIYEFRKQSLERKDLLAISRLSNPREPRELASRFDRDYKATDWNVWSALISDLGSARTVDVLRAAGFDGIKNGKTWVVFSPSQIRTAIGEAKEPAKGGPTKSARVLEEPEVTVPTVPLHPTKTEPFKNWFKQSKVTDRLGEPIVVYHGTDAEFSAFALGHVGAQEMEGGPFFTDNSDIAADYGSRIIEAYVSIQKPYEMTYKKWLSGKGPTVEALKKKGYDGFIVTDFSSNGNDAGADEVDDKGTVYVPFSSATQIKSADENTGRFDPDNPDIYDKDPIDSYQFKRWFKDSYVKGSDQRPKVVYHGTKKTFEEFDTGESGSMFTTKKSDAAKYAGDGGEIMPVFLSIQNPYITDINGWDGDAPSPSSIKEDATHDGYIVEDWSGPGEDLIIAFCATQIKSAKANTGRFDPGNPNIYDHPSPVKDLAHPERDELKMSISGQIPPPNVEAPALTSPGKRKEAFAQSLA